jgi:NTE family protein
MRHDSSTSRKILRATSVFNLLATILLLPAASHVSNPQASAARPKISLVMGGDGALGFVQVGVLRWMEENYIPIDSVVGTSMGGFVGGVYATGVSPHEIQDFLQRIDWDNTFFLGEAPYLSKGEWNQKNDLAEMENLDTFRGLKLSSLVAFLPMQNRAVMTFPFLPRIVNSYSDLQSFDTLATPFRCTAVDLISGDVVVMNQGSLPLALTATMALPGLMDPVRTGGKLLAGGGPLPVEVARSGTDVVIASYVYSHAEFRSDMSVSEQIRRTLESVKAEADRREIRQADVVIPVDTSTYYRLDLSRIEALVQLGYTSAAERSSVLLKFSVSPEEWRHYLEDRKRRRIR